MNSMRIIIICRNWTNEFLRQWQSMTLYNLTYTFRVPVGVDISGDCHEGVLFHPKMTINHDACDGRYIC